MAVGRDNATLRSALLQPSLGPNHNDARFRRNSKRTLNVPESWSHPCRIHQADTEDVSFLPRCELPVGVSVRRITLAFIYLQKEFAYSGTTVWLNRILEGEESISLMTA